VTCGSCGARLRRHEQDNGLCDECDALSEQPIQGHPKPEAAKHQVNDGLVQVDCSGSAEPRDGVPETIIKSLGRLVSEAQIPPQWYREIQAALADLDDRISTVERAYNDAQRLEEIGGLS
jgi:hypothetical protein